ncbi:O-antigen ligase [Marinobacter sp. AC-23]|uniref:O-antigen ligase family protein n=1 Tax=Marinobacter sp. AC-23 TaxID=1879031 RepID=UPI001C31C5A7|nr:O-antigen ligase family protein [Marinobacter sp. AC-23]
MLLAVLAPDSVYKHFFHATILPLSLYLLISRKQKVDWKDPFLGLFLVYCVYMSIITWVVANTSTADNAQASRWGLEAGAGMLAFFLWIQEVIKKPREWGAFFLSAALVGALAGLVGAPVEQLFTGRLEGIGAAEHSIQGASILIVFLAVGMFLLFGQRDSRMNRKSIALGLIAFFLVSVFVVSTKSRAPIVALAIYVLFFISLITFKTRSKLALGGTLAVVAGLIGLVHGFIGIPDFIEQLMSRGTSYRLDIWAAYLKHPPESILLGNGAGLGFEFTAPHQAYLAPRGLDIVHPHSIWLGAYAETGLIGVAMQFGLLILVAWAAFRCPCAMSQKLHLLMIVGLFVMLTFSDEYTLLISVHPIWIFGWIPLVLVWAWARARSGETDPEPRVSGSEEETR